MIIRPAAEGDRAAMRDICLETCSDEYLLAHKDVLWLLYCDYYLDVQRENCFVVDDGLGAKGYILCAPDPKKYIADWQGTYNDRLAALDPERVRAQRLTLLVCRLLKKGYPAHLHIDLTAAIRRSGVGTALVTRLFERLKELGVGGVHLGCYRYNEQGVRFYEKLGFKRLIVTRDTIVFGKKL